MVLGVVDDHSAQGCSDNVSILASTRDSEVVTDVEEDCSFTLQLEEGKEYELTLLINDENHEMPFSIKRNKVFVEKTDDDFIDIGIIDYHLFELTPEDIRNGVTDYVHQKIVKDSLESDSKKFILFDPQTDENDEEK